MRGDAPKTDDRHEAAYLGARDAVRSSLRTVVLGTALCLVGVVGLVTVWMTGTAYAGGTATRVTFFAGLFGVAATVLAGHELHHL